MSHLTETHPVGTALINADRWTDWHNDGRRHLVWLTQTTLKILMQIGHCVSPFSRKQYKYSWVFLQSAQYCYLILTYFGISWQIFIKVTGIQVHWNVSCGSHTDTCGQTDRQTNGHSEANRCFLQVCECVIRRQILEYCTCSSGV
jgi:hypothetical protein